MNSIVQTPGKSGATGLRAQSLRDEIRHLWTRMQSTLPRRENEQARIAFCSTHPGEGTTSVATNFSIFLGDQGQHATLLECNLRSPSLADHFGVHRSPGICEYLAGDCSLEEAKRELVAPGLDLLPAGSPPVDVFATLGRDGGIARLFDAIGGHGNDAYCILDTPPLSLAPEAAPILQSVDAAVLVVQADRTRRRSVEKSLQTFDELGIACCGIVLNRVQYEIPPFIDQVL